MAEFHHIPVMLDEVLEALQPEEGKVFIDGTLGGGGHTGELLKRGATVYGIDRDADALAAATARLSGFAAFHAVRGNFHDMKALAAENEIPPLDGVLLDLGVSSFQLDTAERTWSKEEIARILREYGEESWADRIAAIILEHRQQTPLRTTGDLVRAVDAAIPRKVRDRDKGHSAQKTFQAIRIAVNDELAPLTKALEDAVDLLAPGGRLVVITFHSLEDRLVKQTFRRMENPCTCPPGLPVCICGKKPTVRLPSRGAIKPSKEETEQNPRARSAKLRVAEKL